MPAAGKKGEPCGRLESAVPAWSYGEQRLRGGTGAVLEVASGR